MWIGWTHRPGILPVCRGQRGATPSLPLAQCANMLDVEIPTIDPWYGTEADNDGTGSSHNPLLEQASQLTRLCILRMQKVQQVWESIVIEAERESKLPSSNVMTNVIPR